MPETENETLVLLTIGCLDIGGAERRLLQLARYLQRKRAPVRLAFYVVSGRKGRLEADFREAGCDIHYGRPNLIGLVNMAQLCKKIKPDVIHANAETAAGFYCLAARLAGVRRRVSHMRSSKARGDSRSTRELIYEWLTGLCSDTIVGVSETALAGKRLGNTKRQVIYNGLDRTELVEVEGSSRPVGFGGAGPDFVILGRLDRLKNIPHAISSFGHFAKEHGDGAGRLHVVGPDGNISAAELKNFAHRVGVEDRVIFHGPTSEPLRYLFHADCALLASAYEGLPGVALEALSCGTPLVASDIPSAVEIMRLSVGVEVVPVSDVRGWSSAMSRNLDLDRSIIRDYFWNRTPFTLERHADEMVEVWGMPLISTQ